jgi:hypothetical protein
MLRRVLLDLIRPPDASLAKFGGVDGFYLPILHALTGSIVIDQQLSAYRIHDSNDCSTLPALHGVSGANEQARTQSLKSYSRVVCWLIDHVDDVVLMAGTLRYWQVFDTAVSTNWRVREAFLQPELKATLEARYLRLVELFGEEQVFQQLRKRLLFPEYLDLVRAAHGRVSPVAEVGRAFLREIVKRLG